MKRFILCVAALCLFSFSVSARINETIEQCRERYGEPKAEKVNGIYPVKYYFKNGMNIMIVFHKNRAVVINYGKPDENNPFYRRAYNRDGWMDTISTPNIMEMNLPLAEKELEFLRDINSEGEKWTKTGENTWQREKKTVAAFYNKNIFTCKVIKRDDEDGRASHLNGL